MLHMEAKLAQLVAPQTKLLAHRPGADGLEPGRDLGHVVSLPVLGVHNNTLALYKRHTLVNTLYTNLKPNLMVEYPDGVVGC